MALRWWIGASAFGSSSACAARSTAAEGRSSVPKRFQALGVYEKLGIASGLFLSMLSSTANAESFSIKCSYTSYFYVSFDTDSGRVVEETLSGSGLKGRIDKIDGERIYFHVLKVGEPNFDLIWDGREKVLITVAIPGNATRGSITSVCTTTELRSMLSRYDDIAP